MQIIVIGAGVGGMVAALRLRQAGHSVTVIEQGGRVGGKLNVWEPEVEGVGRFRFDTGPHVLTMPWALRELFDDLGEPMDDYLDLQRIDPICRYHFADATPFFDAPADPAVARGAVATRFPGDEDGFADLLRYARRVQDVTVEPFLRQDFGGQVRGAPTLRQWRQLVDFLALRPWETLDRRIARHVRHPKLRQIFELYAFYNGSSPYLASAIYAIIAHVQWGDGTYYLRGGLRTLADALERLAAQRGVEVRLNTPVAEILFAESGAGNRNTKPRVVGVRAQDGEILAADAVVCNADPLTTYAHLVSDEFRPAAYSPQKLRQMEPSTSAFLMLLGVRGSYNHLAHYNSFLPGDGAAEYKTLFDKETERNWYPPLPDEPVVGVTCQSVTERDCAPPGHSNLFVMTSVPPLPAAQSGAIAGEGHWTNEGKRVYRSHLLQLLEVRCGLTDLRKRIVCEQVWTPETFTERYGAWRGSLYGLSSNSWRNGFLRPPNRAKHARGLYFVGGGTHPGGGLPLVTLGAKIVADAVLEDFGAAKK